MGKEKRKHLGSDAAESLTVAEQRKSKRKKSSKDQTEEQTKAAKALRKEARAERRKRKAERRQAREGKRLRKEKRARKRQAETHRGEKDESSHTINAKHSNIPEPSVTETMENSKQSKPVQNTPSITGDESERHEPGPNLNDDISGPEKGITDPLTAQKKRGRPRKETQKQASSNETQKSTTGKPRGRPRKTPVAQTSPSESQKTSSGKPRGRPRKAPVVQNSSTLDTTAISSTGDNAAKEQKTADVRVPTTASNAEEVQLSGDESHRSKSATPSTATRPNKEALKAKFLLETADLSDESLIVERLLDWEQLRWLAEDRGLRYRTGPFTSWEDDRVGEALDAFQRDMDMTDEQFTTFLYGKRDSQEAELFTKLWRTVTAAVPGRPNRAVRARVRRLRTPKTHKGAWTQHEEDMLAICVDRFANRVGASVRWGEVAAQVGRSAEDCRLRWRDQQEKQDNPKERWTVEETQELATAVAEHTGPSASNNAKLQTDWTKVCAALGNRRTRIQCVSKWRSYRENQAFRDGVVVKWNPAQHGSEFIRRMKLQKNALRKDDLKEIDMTKLARGWYRWSARRLRLYWRDLYNMYVRNVDDKDDEPIDYDRNLQANIKVIEKGLQGLIEARPLSRRNVDLIDSEEEI